MMFVWVFFVSHELANLCNQTQRNTFEFTQLCSDTAGYDIYLYVSVVPTKP